MNKISREALLKMAMKAGFKFNNEGYFYFRGHEELVCVTPNSIDLFADLVLASQQQQQQQDEPVALPDVKESSTSQGVLTAGEIEALGLGVFGIEHAEIVAAAERGDESAREFCDGLSENLRWTVKQAAKAIRSRRGAGDEPQETPAVSVPDDVAKDAWRYRLLRHGRHWSVIDGIGEELRGEVLDAAIDAAAQKGGAA